MLATLCTCGKESTVSDDIHKMGGWFTVAAWVIGLGLLTVLFQKQFYAEPDVISGMDENGLREVQLYRDLSGHYQLDGRINGHHADLLIDSGATLVSVPADLADDIGLHRGRPFNVGTANGTITNYATTLSRLDFGGFELKNVRASINPGMSGTQVLLGMNVLSRFEMIQRDNRLTLRLP